MNTPISLKPDYAGAPKAFWRTTAEKLLHTRAATSPTSTSTANVPTPIAVGPLLTGLAPASALMALFARCSRVDMGGVHDVLIPRVDSITAPTLFVAEGSPHPVFQASTAAQRFGPACKLLVSAVVTGEIMQYSLSAQSLAFEKALGEKVQALVDAVGFDTTAATSGLRPAGLLNGVSDLGATAGGGIAALVGDLEKIAGEFSDAAIASDDLMIFANPREAIKMRGLLSPAFAANYTIVGTPAITAKQIVAIAPSAILSGFSGEPTIEISSQGTVHLEDTTALDITTASVATTVKSLWQSNLLALRLRMNLCWAPLMSGAVQTITTVSW